MQQAWHGGLSEAIVNNGSIEPGSGRGRRRRRLSACVDAAGGHFEHYL